MQGIVTTGKGNIKAAGKTVTEVMRSTALQSHAVMHHRLNGIGLYSTGKAFLFGLAASYNGNSQCFFIEIGINLQHTEGFLLRFFFCFMDGVAFLPEKFRGSQEGTGRFLPAHHRTPLIIELRQVTIGIHDFGVMLTEQGFGGRTHTQTLGKLFTAAHRNPCTFRGKTFYMILFLLEQTFGNKHRHIDIFMAGTLKTSVHILLDIFPDSIAVGTNDHTALHAGIID